MIYTQPLCRYRVMGETITILPPLKRAVKNPNVGVNAEFSKILGSAVFLNDTNWGSLTRMVEEHTNQSWTLLDAYEDIERNQSLWSKVKRFVQETVTILITVIMGVLAVIMVGLCLRAGARLCRELRRRKTEKDLERERATQRKLVEDLRLDLKKRPDTPPETLKDEGASKLDRESRSPPEEEPEIERRSVPNEPSLTRTGLEEARSLQLKILEDIEQRIVKSRDPRSPVGSTTQTPQAQDPGPEVESVGSAKRRSRSRSVSISSQNRDQPNPTRDRSGSLRTTRTEPRPLLPTNQRAVQGQWPVAGIPIMGATYPTGEDPQFM